MRLHMALRQRLSIASVFLVACTADLSSILRIYYAFLQARSSDTWDFYAPAIATIFEIGLGQICVSLPALRPLMLQYLKGVNPFSRHYGRADYYGSGATLTEITEKQNRSDSGDPWLHSSYAGAGSIKPLDGEFSGIKVVNTVELDTISGNNDDDTLKGSQSQDDVLLERSP